MFFDFCICDAPQKYGELILDTIFYINGDQTYDTPKKAVTSEKTYLLYTLRGEGVVSYNGRTFTAHANHFIYMQPERDFSYRCKNDKWEFWWFEFFGPCPCEPDRQYRLAADPMVKMLVSKSLYYAKCSDWRLATTLLDALNQVFASGAGHSRRDLNNQRIITAAESYIRENLQSVTVRELAEALGIEERTLRNLCNAAVGMSPKQMIMKMRMGYAGYLLASTTYSLEEIALRLGFSSQYHFGKVFKEFYTVSPIRYRKYIDLR